MRSTPVVKEARRDAIDVARVLALLLVVCGHLFLAVVDRGGAGDEVRGVNLLDLRPTWAWIAALAPMPVFFAAAGWANSTSPLAASAPRLRTLVGVGAVVVTVWALGVVGTVLVTGDTDDPGLVADGARIATQPLWFLAAYVPFAAAGRQLASVARRTALFSIGGCLVGLAALDVVRFVFDGPDWVGWPGFFLAWGVPWLLGAWWRSRVTARGHSREWDERRTGALLAIAGAAACAVLVHAAGYSIALIDAVDGARSNTTPPTLYTAAAATAQVGVLLVIARPLDRAGRKWHALWTRAGEAAVGVYVWHLTALSLCVGLLALGLPAPERLTGLWWATRPVWWALVLAVTAAFVALSARLRAALASTATTGARTTTLAGVVSTVAAAGFVGLEGPQTLTKALASAALFVAAWRLL